MDSTVYPLSGEKLNNLADERNDPCFAPVSNCYRQMNVALSSGDVKTSGRGPTNQFLSEVLQGK